MKAVALLRAGVNEESSRTLERLAVEVAAHLTGIMRHGHEMFLFVRRSFSESELPLSYNAKL